MAPTHSSQTSSLGIADDLGSNADILQCDRILVRSKMSCILRKISSSAAVFGRDTAMLDVSSSTRKVSDFVSLLAGKASTPKLKSAELEHMCIFSSGTRWHISKSEAVSILWTFDSSRACGSLLDDLNTRRVEASDKPVGEASGFDSVGASVITGNVILRGIEKF